MDSQEQAGHESGERMTTTTEPDTALAPLKGPITQHVAETLAGIHKINGHFIKIDPTVKTDNEITLELTRRRFGGDDCAVRVTLTINDPQDTTPAALPDTIEPRSAALLEIWAPSQAMHIARATEDPPKDAA